MVTITSIVTRLEIRRHGVGPGSISHRFVTLGRSLNLCALVFPSQNGEDGDTHPTGLP